MQKGLDFVEVTQAQLFMLDASLSLVSTILRLQIRSSAFFRLTFLPATKTIYVNKKLSTVFYVNQYTNASPFPSKLLGHTYED